MEITLATPALLFPAITLLLLAYANRFFNLSKLIRELHAQKDESQKESARRQIGNLRRRLGYIKWMQVYGILGIQACMLTMLAVFFKAQQIAQWLLLLGMILLLVSLMYALRELFLSDKALSIALQDMEK